MLGFQPQNCEKCMSDVYEPPGLSDFVRTARANYDRLDYSCSSDSGHILPPSLKTGTRQGARRLPPKGRRQAECVRLVTDVMVHKPQERGSSRPHWAGKHDGAPGAAQDRDAEANRQYWSYATNQGRACCLSCGDTAPAEWGGWRVEVAGV